MDFFFGTKKVSYINPISLNIVPMPGEAVAKHKTVGHRSEKKWDPVGPGWGQNKCDLLVVQEIPWSHKNPVIRKSTHFWLCFHLKFGLIMAFCSWRFVAKVVTSKWHHSQVVKGTSPGGNASELNTCHFLSNLPNGLKNRAGNNN